MTRLLVFLIIIALIVVSAVGAMALSQMPGSVDINAFGIDVSLNLVWSVIALLALGGIAYFIWWLVVGFVTLPWKFGASRKQARARKANKALADGLLAAEAGDAKTAAALAKKAAKHADDERLKLLLDARTAEASGDWIGAERAWGLLTRLPGGELAGLRGAAAAAMERGDQGAAEANAKQALTVKSSAEWPFNSLFDLQVARHEWGKALETLAQGEQRKFISGAPLARRRAVLYTALSQELPRAERPAIQKALADALKAAPGFPPAAWFAAKQLIAEDKTKAAQNILEMSWKARPHPALSRLCRQLPVNEKATARLRRLKALVDAQPDHRESRILSSELAMESGKWPEAVRTLAILVEEEPTARLCLLMEQALKGYGDKDEAARWARMAVTAAREADWSDLDPKGGAFGYAPTDWSRLVYRFGDAEQLVHPRYESFGRELDASRPALALPAPGAAPAVDDTPLPRNALSAPLDYAPSKD